MLRERVVRNRKEERESCHYPSFQGMKVKMDYFDKEHTNLCETTPPFLLNCKFLMESYLKSITETHLPQLLHFKTDQMEKTI